MWAWKATCEVGSVVEAVGGGWQRAQLGADRKGVEVVFGVELEREMEPVRDMPVSDREMEQKQLDEMCEMAHCGKRHWDREEKQRMWESLEGRARGLEDWMETQRGGEGKRSQGFREERRGLPRRMNKCERQVGQGQEGSTPPQSIPAARCTQVADQGGTLRSHLFPISLSR